MALSVQSMLTEVRKIVSGLNTEEIRTAAARNLRVGLAAGSEEGYRAMELFLCPDTTHPERATQMIHRIDLTAEGADGPESCDFVLCESLNSLGPLPLNGFRFVSHDPVRTAEAVLADHPELELALGRNFPEFRPLVAAGIVHRISSENALFSLVSALPNVIPNILELPWVVGEFATDTAFLTMNQIRMALHLAAVYDRPVGYSEQKLQIAAIAGGAFGWRALARELAGKIPLGGGLIPKAAISFAGTWVVGLGLERANRLGRGLTARERREAYKAALEKGKVLARNLLPSAMRTREANGNSATPA
jgi:hypothetical protein